VKAQGQFGGRGRRFRRCRFGCVHVLVRCGRCAFLSGFVEARGEYSLCTMNMPSRHPSLSRLCGRGPGRERRVSRGYSGGILAAGKYEE
jgi:hypothetical protein